MKTILHVYDVELLVQVVHYIEIVIHYFHNQNWMNVLKFCILMIPIIKKEILNGIDIF